MTSNPDFLRIYAEFMAPDQKDFIAAEVIAKTPGILTCLPHPSYACQFSGSCCQACKKISTSQYTTVEVPPSCCLDPAFSPSLYYS